MQVMTEIELKTILANNIKKYRKGKYTQESLAEASGVSSQNINDIEGRRRWPRESTLIKIANVLNVEVYQLFIPENTQPVIIDDTPENEKIRNAICKQVVSSIRKQINSTLNKIENL